MWALVESNNISKIYARPTALELNGIRHPANIFSLWTEAELKAIGIYEITVDRSNFKDTTYYSNTAITYTYNSGNDTVTGAYGTATAKDLATLKVQKKNLINEEAFSTLKDSDWLAIRAAEGGTAVPSAWATWRAGVRTKTNDMQTLIDNAADVDALAALYVYNLDDPPTRPLGVFPDKPS